MKCFYERCLFYLSLLLSVLQLASVLLKFAIIKQPILFFFSFFLKKSGRIFKAPGKRLL